MGTPYWYGDPHIGMGRDMSIFQIGESPYQYGVHSNLGTNIYTIGRYSLRGNRIELLP
jgi:hypothetical protein